MPRPHTTKSPFALLPAACLTLTAITCAMAQTTPPADGMPTVAPTHVPVFNGSDAVASIAFAPDKPSLYVLSHVLSANPWPSLVARWPEILGGIVALATVAFLLALLRLKRRPRIAGKPYCRRCNYDLTHQVIAATNPPTTSCTWPTAARCPECGTPLDRANPIRGRRFSLRLAPPLAIWLCFVLPYAALFALRTPRNCAAMSWLDLSSTWAAANADSFALKWLGLKPSDTDQVVEVDLVTGKVIRTVGRRESKTHFTLAISTDGRTLFLQGRDTNALDAVGVATGRITHSTILPGTPIVDVRGPAVLGFTPDGSAAYVQWWNETANKSGVARWNWRTGKLDPSLAEVAGFARNPGNYPRLFGLRDHNAINGAPRFYSIPNFMQTFPTKKFNIMLHDDSPTPQSIDVQPIPNPVQHPAVSADGNTLYLAGEYTTSMLGIDLNSGARIGPLQSTANASHFVTTANGRYVVLSGMREVHVRDTAQKKWHLRATLPPVLYASRASASPDGRWLAAVCQGGGNPSPFFNRVVIWDLADHRLIEPPAAP